MCAICLMLVATIASAQKFIVTDDAGRTLTFDGPVKRIVSLAPHITELLFAAGAGARIVGTVEYSDYPEPAKQIERIGNHSVIDLERVATLRPDLIVAWQSGNPRPALEKLELMGYPMFYSEPRTIEDIVSTMNSFSAMAGTQDTAAPEVRQFRRDYQRLKAKYADKPVVTVFYEIWNQPMMTINGQHLISEVIRLCGGHNVFAELDKLAANVGIEPVLAADPDVIIASSNNGKAPHWLFDWKRWKDLNAVRFDNLFFVNWNHINRHSPRILKGVRDVCELLEKARANMRQ